VPVPALVLGAPVPALAVGGDAGAGMTAFLHDFWSRVKGRNHQPPARLPLRSGLYHFRHELPGETSRIHLRIDPDGKGTLVVNAARVIHLNSTAAAIAYLVLEQASEAQVLQELSRVYQVSTAQARADYQSVRYQVEELIRPDGACPVCDLNIETTAPFSDRPTAPYRMDLALTYRCNNACAHCYNARPRHYPEMNTDQWKKVLDRCWELGIPHIVFTGGEPTLRDDLPELIRHAEENGQITGLNTNGRRLSDSAWLGTLVDAGLDHVQITFESHLPEIHDAIVAARGAWDETAAGLRNALATRLFVMTNTTLLQANSPYLEGTLDYLAEAGVPTVGLNALIYSGRGLNVGTGLKESELPALLDIACQKTSTYNQRLVWYTPTCYCQFDPLQLELGVKGCTAALYNMCIEPDGGVIPCQSYYQTLGNILNDPWQRIWQHDLATSLRERRNLPGACSDCALLAECGGGCPLARAALPSLEYKPIDHLMIGK